MHPHLHTASSKGCEDVMRALEECHARGFIHKMLGGCTNAKEDVNMCLRAARLERTAANRERAKDRNARVQARWNEIDANS